MILEMRRALEEIESKNQQGYKKLFDATYEEVYSRSLLIIQREDQAAGVTEEFYTALFGKLKNGEYEQDLERWFLHQYYQTLRKQYHKLLSSQEKGTALKGTCTLSKIPASFPLLHRIMLVMYYQDDFSVEEIFGIYGLSEDKIYAELEKLEKAFPNLVKDQPEEVAAYLGNFKLLLLGASKEVLRSVTYQGMDAVYEKAARAAGITVKASAAASKDDFEYFVADVDMDLETPKPKKKPAPIPEEEEDDDLDPDEEEEIDEEEDDEDEDEDEEENDRYDWDMEDDGRKMVILGIILALIFVVLVAFAAFKFLNKDKDEEEDQIQTEEQLEGEDGAPLIIKGGEDGEEGDNTEGDDAQGEEQPEQPEETPEEQPEEQPEETPEEAPEATTMTAIPNSMNVRSEPNTSSTVLTTVKAGEKLEILGDASQEWVQIRCIEQDNQEGYVMTQYLKAE